MAQMKVKQFKDVVAEAKAKIPRDQKEIEQDYSNAAAAAGDQHFKCELERGKLQRLTVKMSEIKDEFDACVKWNKEKAEQEQKED